MAKRRRLKAHRRACVGSQRSSYFSCCWIHVVDTWSRNVLTRDLIGSTSASCSLSYTSELNSVDCTPPAGCRMNLLTKYAGPDVLRHYSDAGYLNLLAPLALLPFETHARAEVRAVVIGGGAGELATTLAAHFRPLQLDVLEPDAAVIALARRFFGFDAPVYDGNGTRVHAGGSGHLSRVRLIQTDALSWLRRSAGSPYHYAVLDAFATGAGAAQSAGSNPRDTVVG